MLQSEYRHTGRAKLDDDRRRRHKLYNGLQSAVIVGGIGAVTLLSTYLLWGWFGVLGGLAMIAIVAGGGPKVPPEAIVRLYRGQQIDPRDGGPLLRVVDILAQRAELPRSPRLYVIPSLTLNAFATGTRDNAAVAVTEGLLRKLTLREIAGVLGHEISHVRNNDLAVMALADAMTRLTQLLSTIAIMLAIFSVPALLAGRVDVSWVAIALLYLAPTISSLLQLGLSRAREYDADLDGASLTGDPAGLASALQALERYQGRFWEDLRFPMPGRRIPQPSLLRSHPATEDRVARLADLTVGHEPVVVPGPSTAFHPFHPARISLSPPRLRLTGVWY